jgi:ADP-ribose pyrophosphatase YjhB (NUDIX family)
MRYTPRVVLYKLLYRMAKIYWFIFRPQVRGVLCLIECGRRFLLIRQTYGKMRWTLPGGLIQRNEEPEIAVRREVREEVGLELSQLNLIGVFKDTHEYAHDTVYCFWGVPSVTELQLDPGEIYEARWFAGDSLPLDQSRQMTMVLDLHRKSMGFKVDSSPA